MNAHCRPISCNVAIPMPPFPPIWGGGPTPPDPVLNATCPVIPATVIDSTAAPFRITVNGTLFTPTTQGTFDGTPMPSTVVSTGQLWFEIDPAAYLVGMHSIGVTDGGVIGATSCPFEITTAVVVLVPTLTSVTPDFVGLNDPVHTLVFIGTNFNANSVVWRGGLPLPTQYISPTQLDVLTSALTATTGTFEMRVANGTGPNTEFSNSIQTQCVNNPVLNMLVPVSTPAGGPAVFEVKLLGQNFGNTAEVLVNGSPVVTRWVSGGDLRFDVNAATGVVGNSLSVSVRLGHQHGATHDNVMPQPAKTLPFNFT
jgi:hypothetical protein